jgi:hypothetical protein
MRGKFPKVKKTKAGVRVKYVRGSKNKRKTEREIKNTARLYAEGKLTEYLMNQITKQRKNSAKKK